MQTAVSTLLLVTASVVLCCVVINYSVSAMEQTVTTNNFTNSTMTAKLESSLNTSIDQINNSLNQTTTEIPTATNETTQLVPNEISNKQREKL